MAYKCQDCNYQCSLNSELTKHINGMHGVKVYKCNFCGEEYKWEYSLNRHMKKHEEHNGEIRLASPIPNKNHFGSGYNVDNIHGVFDIRLKENFKLFQQDRLDVVRPYFYPIYLKIYNLLLNCLLLR